MVHLRCAQGGTGAVDGRRSLYRANDINPFPCLVLEAALAAWSAFSFSVIGAHERRRGSGLAAAAELWVAVSVVLVMLGSLLGEGRCGARAPGPAWLVLRRKSRKRIADTESLCVQFRVYSSWAGGWGSIAPLLSLCGMAEGRLIERDGTEGLKFEREGSAQSSKRAADDAGGVGGTAGFQGSGWEGSGGEAGFGGGGRLLSGPYAGQGGGGTQVREALQHPVPEHAVPAAVRPSR